MSTPDDSGQLSAREVIELYTVLGLDIAAQANAAGALQAVTNVAVRTVSGAHYASITRNASNSGSTFTTVAPTDDAAVMADRIQYEVGSGPCIDAITDNTRVLSGDVRNDPRWPKFGPQAADDAGIASALAVRMMLDEQGMVAALNLYSRDVNAFDTDAETVCMLLATHACYAVSHVMAREKTANLEQALTTSREIGMAMGVLMATHKVSRDQAFDLLRITSQTTHRKLADIARGVADTGHLQLPGR